MYCPRCGAENPEEAKFCGSCAAKLPTSAELAASPPAAPLAPAPSAPPPAPVSQAPPAQATIPPAPQATSSTAPSGWGQPAASPASHWAQPPGRQPQAWGQPRSATAAATTGGASTLLSVLVILGTLILPLVGIVMGILYMVDADPARKSIGRIWLGVGIVWGVIWLMIAISV